MGNGKATCEASAIVYDGSKFLIANDKDMPDGKNSVFYYKGKHLSEDTVNQVYIKSPIFRYGKKYEDFARSPDGLIFLTTAFDRKKDNSDEWDAYNTILYWPKGKEESPQVLSDNAGAQTSISLRNKIATVLADDEFKGKMPYFKIEGLAATNTHLYFGIRETGKNFQNPKYTVKIIETPYTVENGVVKVGAMTLICNFSPQAQLNTKLPLGLSSIEYDPYNRIFLIITSYETGENIGAYIWTSTLDGLKRSQLQPLNGTDRKPLLINSKAEDIAIINKNTFYLIHDDDRIKTPIGDKIRQLNQAIYSVIRVKH